MAALDLYHKLHKKRDNLSWLKYEEPIWGS